MGKLPWARRVAALASLADDKRLRIFELVAAAPHALGRDEVAGAAGVPRSTASFHLDRLVQDGLLSVEFHKPPERSGPGSGRPAKMYRPAAHEVTASVPERNYDLAGEVLAAAIERAQTTGETVGDALREAAFTAGRDQAGGAASLEDFLTATGYRPVPDGSGGYTLPNCPFHRLSREYRDVVCVMNGAFLRGAAQACRGSGDDVAAAAGPGGCCARINADAAAETSAETLRPGAVTPRG